jgi:DNA-binding phage protein
MKNTANRVETRDDRVMVIMKEMSRSGLPNSFVLDAGNLARQDNAILGLLELWIDESDKEEKAEIVADLQDHIDDDRELPRDGKPVETPKISFENLDEVVADVAKFKDRLKDIIDRNGGVVAVAKKVGMPQPSLSRLLNSGTMPRRSTLYKIAKALDLSETDIAGEWIR